MSIETMAYRSAETGQFVTRKFVYKNPKTTVKETIKLSKPAPKKGK